MDSVKRSMVNDDANTHSEVSIFGVLTLFFFFPPSERIRRYLVKLPTGFANASTNVNLKTDQGP